MNNDELCLLPIEDAAKLIGSKQVSPVELTEAVLARIERLNPQLNAYMTVTAEQALDSARAAADEIASGTHRGPLHGIPIAHKDLFDTKDVRTTAGSKIFADRVPDADATVVQKLAAAGAITLGKLGMHEWAFGGTSLNPHFGAIRNPWDTSRIPGGSSGGSGAATAAGLAFAATGSDTGGSIRMPASLCGVVGLMPTYGRASLRNVVPLSWTLDHPGPLVRTVRDAAVVLQAIAGHDPADPYSRDIPVPDYLDGIERGPKGLRVGVPKQYFWGRNDPAVEALVRKAIADLETAGAEVREVDFAQVEAYFAAFSAIIVTDAAAYHKPMFPARKDDYGADVAMLLGLAPSISAADYAIARHVTAIARAGEADALLDGIDVLAVPTTPTAAPTIEEAMTPQVAGVLHIYTSIFDVTGQPAISVPCGLTPAGLPAGLMLVAQQWDEATLLRAARAYEMVRGPLPSPSI